MKENIDPPMHTAEHILNQTMVRLFSCDRCFSAHIEKKKSKCDYKFSRALTDAEIKNIEKQVNEIIQSDLPITFEMVPMLEAKKQFDSRTPEGQDLVKVVKISDYDAIPCIGGHVKSTKEIGEFRIISTNYDNGVLRIRYKLK